MVENTVNSAAQFWWGSGNIGGIETSPPAIEDVAQRICGAYVTSPAMDTHKREGTSNPRTLTPSNNRTIHTSASNLERQPRNTLMSNYAPQNNPHFVTTPQSP